VFLWFSQCYRRCWLSHGGVGLHERSVMAMLAVSKITSVKACLRYLKCASTIDSSLGETLILL
ncbi:MAG: hypothetical protein K6T73_10125, partial [Candidatus Bathyarchaeota archaeon]|nr:hypothetical protein [Candidatus Bathyarchaeota archaeon]